MAEVPVRAGRGRSLATLAAIGVALAMLLSLGTWQVYRLQWKEALIASIDARRTAAPVSLAEIEARLKAGQEIDYVPVTVSGHFEHQFEQYFLATDDGGIGYHVYTPLILADGRALFVNRGFVAEEVKDPASRKQGEVTGEVTITGLARQKLSSKPSSMVPDNEPAKNLFFWKDLDQMAKNAAIPADRLLPLFVDANAAANPGGWPRGGVTQIDLPNNHLSYAFTWYGLAAALLAVSVLAFRKKPR